MYSLIAMPQGAEWLVILAIVILVFGAAKLPDLARGTGQALRIFKAETKGLVDDDDEQKAADEHARQTRAIEGDRATGPIVPEAHPQPHEQSEGHDRPEYPR